ncbi:hypothetical protein FACS18948_3410 [Clostridia bacterium]|nr:hypothetical protein FACS18948_3410 [Clostridia bacterium]
MDDGSNKSFELHIDSADEDIPTVYTCGNFAQLGAALEAADADNKEVYLTNVIELTRAIAVAGGKVLLTAQDPNVPVSILNVASSSNFFNLQNDTDMTCENVVMNANSKSGIVFNVYAGSAVTLGTNAIVQNSVTDTENTAAIKLGNGTEDSWASLTMTDNAILRDNSHTPVHGNSGVLAGTYARVTMRDNSSIQRCSVKTSLSNVGRGAAIFAMANSEIDIGGHAGIIDCYCNAANYAYGGAIHASACSVTIHDDAYINGCSTTATSGGGSARGGAIFAENSCIIRIRDNVEISANKTSGGSSPYGGAIYITSGGLYISGKVILSQNQAGQLGGAICQNGTGEVAISGNTQLIGNTAQNGGAVYFSTLLNVYDNVIFANNTASANGGAIASAKGVGDSISIAQGVVFDNNSAAGGYIITGADKTKADQLVLTHKVTQPFTDAYNNWDIAYTGGSPANLKTLTFVSNGGSLVLPQQFLESLTPNKPDDPTRANSVFRGWYTDADLTQPYNFDDTLTDAAPTLYARWICLPGFRPDANACLASGCLPSQHYDPQLSECVNNNCAPDEMWDGEGCLRVECPDGYVYDPIIGYCGCPNGMVSNTDGECGYPVHIDGGEEQDPLDIVLVPPDDFVKRPPNPPDPPNGVFIDWFQRIDTTRATTYQPFDFNKPVTGPITLVAKFSCKPGFRNLGTEWVPRCLDSNGTGGGLSDRMQDSLVKVVDSIAAVEMSGVEMLNAGVKMIEHVTSNDAEVNDMTSVLSAVADMTNTISHLECATKDKLCCTLEKLCNCGLMGGVTTA